MELSLYIGLCHFFTHSFCLNVIYIYDETLDTVKYKFIKILWATSCYLTISLFKDFLLK